MMMVIFGFCSKKGTNQRHPSLQTFFIYPKNVKRHYLIVNIFLFISHVMFEYAHKKKQGSRNRSQNKVYLIWVCWKWLQIIMGWHGYQHSSDLFLSNLGLRDYLQFSGCIWVQPLLFSVFLLQTGRKESHCSAVWRHFLWPLQEPAFFLFTSSLNVLILKSLL